MFVSGPFWMTEVLYNTRDRDSVPLCVCQQLVLGETQKSVCNSHIVNSTTVDVCSYCPGLGCVVLVPGVQCLYFTHNVLRQCNQF